MRQQWTFFGDVLEFIRPMRYAWRELQEKGEKILGRGKNGNCRVIKKPPS